MTQQSCECLCAEGAADALIDNDIYARLQFKDEFYAVLSGAQREIRHFFVEGGSFYLTRPLLLGEVPHPLLNTLASPKSFTLGNDQIHLS